MTMVMMPEVMQWQPAVAVAVVVITIITIITIITQLRSLQPLLLSALPFRLFAWVLALLPLVPEPFYCGGARALDGVNTKDFCPKSATGPKFPKCSCSNLQLCSV